MKKVAYLTVKNYEHLRRENGGIKSNGIPKGTAHLEEVTLQGRMAVLNKKNLLKKFVMIMTRLA